MSSDHVYKSLRLPRPVADWLAERAKNNFRSANGEVIHILERQRASDGALPERKQSADNA